MRPKRPWMLPIGLLLLAGLTGCSTKTPTTSPDSKTTPVPGCRVERLEDAEQAIRQLHDISHAHVYRIDGDLATCKLEVFYRPDEDSEETLVWSVAGDALARSLQDEAEALGLNIDPHNYHHVLAIAAPESRPKPDDEFVFSFSIRCMSNDGVEKKTLDEHFRDSKEAKELFPYSLVATAGNGGSGGWTRQNRMIKPGEESMFVERRHYWRDQSEKGLGKKRDLVRYRVSVTCLDGSKLPDRGDGVSDEEKDETTEEPEATEEPNAEERAVAEIKKLGGKVGTVRDYFGADAPARSEWVEDEVEPDWLVVDLTETQVTDASLQHLKGLTNLYVVWFEGKNVTDAGLQHLEGFTKLSELDLSRTQITDDGFQHLSGLTNLQNLAVPSRVTDAGLPHLSGLTNLTMLSLSDTGVTNAGLPHLLGLKNLRVLNLGNTEVTDAGLEHLKELTNLARLDLRNTKVTDAGVNDLKKSLPECKTSH